MQNPTQVVHDVSFLRDAIMFVFLFLTYVCCHDDPVVLFCAVLQAFVQCDSAGKRCHFINYENILYYIFI